MIFRRIVITLNILAGSLAILSAFSLSAQEYKNPQICYNLGFQTYFDNREFAGSPYDKSGNPFRGELPLANGDMFRLYAGVIPSEYRLEGLGFGFYDRLNLYYSYYFPPDWSLSWFSPSFSTTQASAGANRWWC